MNKKALVVGAEGFIGSNLAVRLKQEGWSVVGIDKKSGMDMKDPHLQEVLEKEKPEIIFHLAGPLQLRYSGVNESFEICADLLEGTKNLLRSLKPGRVKKFLFSSSGAVYGNATEVPTPESYPAQPFLLYGIATLLFENLLQQYERETGIPVTILRLSNVYGPGQWQNGIQRFAEAMLRDESPALSGDGTSTRDYAYIDDVAEAFFKAATSSASGIFNIGSSKETSLNEVFQVLANEMHWNGKPTYQRNGDPIARSALDCAKAKGAFSWEPHISFEEGIQRIAEGIK